MWQKHGQIQQRKPLWSCSVASGASSGRTFQSSHGRLSISIGSVLHLILQDVPRGTTRGLQAGVGSKTKWNALITSSKQKYSDTLDLTWKGHHGQTHKTELFSLFHISWWTTGTSMHVCSRFSSAPSTFSFATTPEAGAHTLPCVSQSDQGTALNSVIIVRGRPARVIIPAL